MKNKSVIFIEPSGKMSNVFENYMKLPLMGSLYLATILHNADYPVVILNENIMAQEIDPFEIEADVFCITALTVSSGRAKQLAAQIKNIYPQSLVIVGGIHASLRPQDFCEVADHVVVGEAETIIVDLVEGRFKEKIVHGVPFEDLDSLPLVNYSLLNSAQSLRTIPVMTSRGCPFDCNFCTVTKIFGQRFRMQSPERIVAEIENTFKYFKSKSYFFYDDNFSADKKRVRAFCDLLTEHKLDINWSIQVRTDLTQDQKLVEQMAAVGLNWVNIGFESIDDEVLAALHKNQTCADIERAIKILHSYGINIHGMFMFGEDNDTPENIEKTVDFAIKNEIDTVQFSILTPFPGTRIYETIVQSNRLLHTTWDYYNGMFIVFMPKNMTPTRLINITYDAYRKFYSLKRNLHDLFLMSINVLLDAAVWNFKRANRYSLDALFTRTGAHIIVGKYYSTYGNYLKYIDKIEKKNMSLK